MFIIEALHPSLTLKSDRIAQESRSANPVMPSRRSRASRITEDEINELLCKLQAVLPETRRSGTTSASEILRETCNHIKRLHRQVEDLGERLSVSMASRDTNSAEAQLMKSLLVAALGGPER